MESLILGENLTLDPTHLTKLEHWPYNTNILFEKRHIIKTLISTLKNHIFHIYNIFQKC
jgi:hypothetical protein